MSRTRTRRTFLKQLSTTAAGLVVGANPRVPLWSRSPNEKLNLGVIGVAGRGAANLRGVSGENIVALCDIDDKKLREAAKRFPRANLYYDYRRMFEQNDLDAVTVSTPDHVHAPASMAALKLGKHVYCEKPLTHSVYEARMVAEAAAKYNCATQLGTQIHAQDNYRRVVELITTGAIGSVEEVHVWVKKSWNGGDIPKDRPPVPSHIHWDLWLGPAPERSYHPCFLPAHWRRYWDYGGGTLNDMACHEMDLPFWALNLRYPLSIECLEGTPVHPDGAGAGLVVRYEFPRRGSLSPVTLTWYDGGKRPTHFTEHKLPEVGDGVLFVGTKGMLISNYSVHKLLPEDKFAGFEPPAPFIPTSIGHHQEWLQACKTGEPTTCNFDYSGALSEAVLLGNVAYRVGKKIEWNGQEMEAKNCPEAEQYLRRDYRKGWTL